jgi:cysteinyl-tRNA synthetase
MHNGFLDFAGEKMSKSLGNVVLVHDLVKVHPGEVLRWALLKGHYRAPLEWTDSLLEQSRRELDYLYGVLERVGPRTVDDGPDDEAALAPLLDDLNTPAAMGRLHALARTIDHAHREGRMALSERRELFDLAGVLGVLQSAPEAWFAGGADAEFKDRVNGLILARDAARKAKNWAEADQLREALNALNVVVMDGPDGATWRLKDPAA